MSRTARYAVALFLLSAWMIAWHPVSDLATRVMATLEQYMLQYPPEKVYLFTDKPHYAVGENVWFKGWLVNGADHYPNSPSKIVYVELVAPDSSVVLQQTLRVVEGTLNGDFYLPHELPAGEYILRAYTAWMRNFDQGFFFQRQLSIGNLTVETKQSTPSDNQLLLRFYPEGGECVAGMPAVFGIEAVDKSGIPINELTIAILDRSGNEVTSAKIFSDGLGRVDLTSIRGEEYSVVVKDASDKKHIGQSYNLPKPLTQGFTMRIEATHNQEIGIQILNNIDSPSMQNQEILILGHVRGIVYYAAVGRTDREEFVAQVDRSRFPPGIIQFTLFTDVGAPVVERLVYNPDINPLTVTMEPNKATYSTRDLAEFSITVKDAD